MMSCSYDKCLEDAEKAIALDPTYVKAYRRIAQAYLGKGNLHVTFKTGF